MFEDRLFRFSIDIFVCESLNSNIRRCFESFCVINHMVLYYILWNYLRKQYNELIFSMINLILVYITLTV